VREPFRILVEAHAPGARIIAGEQAPDPVDGG
jgi:hypothetical protein